MHLVLELIHPLPHLHWLLLPLQHHIPHPLILSAEEGVVQSWEARRVAQAQGHQMPRVALQQV